MERFADTDAPLIAPIARRWSPRAFSPRPLSAETLRTLLEAARWAPSCFNEQPWRFVVARQDEPEGFAVLAGLLNEKNRLWAAQAPVLMLSLACTTFRQNGKPNAHAWHDVGLAVSQLVLQASAEGVMVHQMAGFDREAARTALGVPPDVAPVAMLALGYPGDPRQLPAELAARESAPRQRLDLSALVFSPAAWGAPRDNGDGG